MITPMAEMQEGIGYKRLSYTKGVYNLNEMKHFNLSRDYCFSATRDVSVPGIFCEIRFGYEKNWASKYQVSQDMH